MNQKTKTLTGLALFTAIIVVLQLLGSFIKFGPFSISLVLIPIVVGAAVYGPKAGAYLGGVFGVVVLIACIAGWDMGGSLMWNANPLLTALVCVGKGALAGLAAGADIATYVLTGLVGVNFVAELLLNVVVSPVIVRIIGARLGAAKTAA